MAEELGQNFKVYVANSTSPYTYSLVAGQRTLQFDAQSNLIDISSKSSGFSGQIAAGRAQLTVTVGGVIVMPDALGLERVYALFTTQAAGMFRINKTNVSPVTVRFAASMFVSNWTEGRDDQDAATYSFSLTMAGATTVSDDLSP